MSARRRIALLAAGGVALLVATAVSLLSFLQSNNVTLQNGGARYTLDVASTAGERALGLGKRASLPDNQGMLFVFGHPAVQCFWMKDMHFPLDMIWVSADKRVEYVKRNVAPATYPHVFCPSVSAQYVIELNGGQAKRADIHIGEALAF